MTSILPVVCAFDRNLCLSAEVTFCTLMHHVSPGTKLCIYVLCSEAGLPEESRRRLHLGFAPDYTHELQFVDVGDAFSNGFQIRGITPPTYYRLLLPGLPIPFHRVLYLDVDTAVVDTVESLFETDLGAAYIAGVRGIFTTMNPERIRAVGADPDEYVNAGVLLMDLKRMREDRLQEDFVELARQELEFQDQDVLNIRCKGRIAHLHPRFNVHCMFDYERHQDLCDRLWPRDQWRSAVLNPAILHYAGEKPWKGSACFYYDVWWKWFHASSAFDREYYVMHQRNRISQGHDTEKPRRTAEHGVFERLGRRLDGLLVKLRSGATNNQ